MFLKSQGGAEIKFVGEAFNVVGNVGELGKSWRSSKNSWGAIS